MAGYREFLKLSKLSTKLKISQSTRHFPPDAISQSNLIICKEIFNGQAKGFPRHLIHYQPAQLLRTIGWLCLQITCKRSRRIKIILHDFQQTNSLTDLADAVMLLKAGCVINCGRVMTREYRRLKKA